MTNKPQPFLGTIGGALAGHVLKQAVGAAIDRVAASTSTSLSPVDAAATTEIVTQEVSKEIAKRVVHQANQEPAYKSRVTIGAIGSILSGTAIILNLVASGDFDPTQIGLAITSVLGGGFAIYGRWLAKKPLGE